MAALLGGTGFGGDLAKKVLLKNNIVIEKASGQSINNSIIGLF